MYYFILSAIATVGVVGAVAGLATALGIINTTPALDAQPVVIGVNDSSADTAEMTEARLEKVRFYLQEMKGCLEKDSLKDKQKIRCIESMENLLSSDKYSPKKRLTKVADFGLSDDVNKVLTKDRDPYFLKLWKELKAFFTGYKEESALEKAFSRYKETLREIKSADAPCPVEKTPSDNENSNGL